MLLTFKALGKTENSRTGTKNYNFPKNILGPGEERSKTCNLKRVKADSESEKNSDDFFYALSKTSLLF